MSTLCSFKPTLGYYLAVKYSYDRKVKMKLENLNYGQLGRSKVIRESEYELHHIVPRYRLKGFHPSVLNSPDNIAILTAREHLMAHYEMCLFESGYFKQSARAAFLMLFNLKKMTFDEIKDLSNDDIELLITQSVEAREKYFGSDAHKRGCSKSGKIAGEKRRLAFANDPTFKKYILDCMKISPDKRKQMSERAKSKNKITPLWDINRASETNGKYIRQSWEYFDSIYIGVFKYNLSYKTIAKVLKVDYKRISNIIRTLKDGRHETPNEFSNYVFAGDFYKRYNATYTENIENLYEYFVKDTPWNKFFDNDAWLILEDLMKMYPDGCTAQTLHENHKIGYLQRKGISAVLKDFRRKSLDLWEHYNSWLIFKQLKQQDGIKEQGLEDM